MSEAFIGQIVLFAGNYAPKNWAFCNGQILQIVQNTALFSILGTTYGGNGQTTFALPDLRGRVPVHCGNAQGPGLSPYQLGEMTGTESVTLLQTQMPAHTHMIQADASAGSAQSPSGGHLAAAVYVPDRDPLPVNTYATGTPASPVVLSPTSILPSGNGLPHPNIQPVLALNYIICLFGIYPARN